MTNLPQGDDPEFSVVILGYGEGDRLPSIVASIDSATATLGVSYEMVLIANYWPGAGDRTPDVAAQLAQQNDRLKVIAKPKAGGMGWDMRCGLEAARGNILAVIDGDGQIQSDDIVKAYRELRRNELDLCQTYRIDRRDGWERRATSRIYNLLFRIVFPGVPLDDINAKPKLMTRALYNLLQLTSSDWFIDAEIIVQARRLGRRMGQIPSTFGRKEGKSYVTVFTILEFLRNLVVFRVRETLSHSKGPWRRR